MEDYTALINVLTSIDNHLELICSHLFWVVIGIFFLLFFKNMNSNDAVDKLYYPIDSIENCLFGIMEKLKYINNSIKKLGGDNNEDDTR